MSTRIGRLRQLIGPTRVDFLRQLIGPRRVDSFLRLIAPTRVDFLNHLVATKGFRSYLEIGVATGSSFEPIALVDKTGVDPYPLADYYPMCGQVIQLTSNDFFARNDRSFDLIFVDGDHRVSQVWHDTVNALRWLNPGGAVVLHDCLPADESEQSQTESGQPWKVIAYLRSSTDLPIAVGDFDHGCGIILPRADQAGKVLDLPEPSWQTLSWRDYDRRRNDILHVLSWRQLQKFLIAHGQNDRNSAARPAHPKMPTDGSTFSTG